MTHEQRKCVIMSVTATITDALLQWLRSLLTLKAPSKHISNTCCMGGITQAQTGQLPISSKHFGTFILKTPGRRLTWRWCRLCSRWVWYYLTCTECIVSLSLWLYMSLSYWLYVFLSYWTVCIVLNVSYHYLSDCTVPKPTAAPVICFSRSALKI